MANARFNQKSYRLLFCRQVFRMNNLHEHVKLELSKANTGQSLKSLIENNVFINNLQPLVISLVESVFKVAKADPKDICGIVPISINSCMKHLNTLDVCSLSKLLVLSANFKASNDIKKTIKEKIKIALDELPPTEKLCDSIVVIADLVDELRDKREFNEVIEYLFRKGSDIDAKAFDNNISCQFAIGKLKHCYPVLYEQNSQFIRVETEKQQSRMSDSETEKKQSRMSDCDTEDANLQWLANFKRFDCTDEKMIPELVEVDSLIDKLLRRELSVTVDSLLMIVT